MLHNIKVVLYCRYTFFTVRVHLLKSFVVAFGQDGFHCFLSILDTVLKQCPVKHFRSMHFYSSTERLQLCERTLYNNIIFLTTFDVTWLSNILQSTSPLEPSAVSKLLFQILYNNFKLSDKQTSISNSVNIDQNIY